MRVFIAVDLDHPARKELEKLLKKLAKKHWAVKWEAAEKVHITLAFLGETEGVGEVEGCVGKAAVSFKPFTLSFKGLGCFPDYLLPRIIWLGLKGDLYNLATLQKTIQAKLIQAGFKPDIKPFVPHITIGRVKHARLGQRQEIGRQIKALQKMEFKSAWKVDRVIIYQSQTLPEGSIYRKLSEAVLG